MMKSRYFLWVALVVASLTAYAQVSVLDRKISLTLNDVVIEEALDRISKAGNFTFSYSPGVISVVEGTVSATFENQTVREVLNVVFRGAVQCKARGNYVILRPDHDQASRKKEVITVAGYVVDESTGQRIRDASVYDPLTLASTVTDASGYFQIKMERPPGDVILSVNRLSYVDTVVTVSARTGSDPLSIPIRLNREKIDAMGDSLSAKFKRLWKGKDRSTSSLHQLNVTDTLYRTAQMSFLPYLGTNLKMSGHVINDYSLNILAGYSRGVNKLEFGGIANLVEGRVEGAQFAGVLNGVGGEVAGVQVAGVLNLNASTSRGAHFAGVLNLHGADSRGVVVAGVGNITAGSQGPAVAGVLNVGGKTATMQVGGVMNVALDTVKGSQVAGVLNVALREVRGSQIAGVLNVARKVQGTQVAFLNVADSMNGVPVGFLSFVKTGYHKIEVGADEVFYNNIAFRTGVPAFYNILFAGAVPATYGDPQTTWTFGYGVGTAPRISRKLQLNIDLTSQQVVYGNQLKSLDLINKTTLGLDWQVFRKMSVVVGATLNAHLTERDAEPYPSLFSGLRPEVFFDRDFGRQHHMRMWLGGKVGIRFF